jgi:hypothetical protein
MNVNQENISNSKTIIESDKVNVNKYQDVSERLEKTSPQNVSFSSSNKNNVNNKTEIKHNDINNNELSQPLNDSNEYDEEVNDEKNFTMINSETSSDEFIRERFSSIIKWKLNENFLIKFLILM